MALRAAHRCRPAVSPRGGRTADPGACESMLSVLPKGRITVSRRIAPLLLALLAACGGNDPSGPSGGSLAVSVYGLPSGATASVSVTGPGGYSHDLSSTETLTGLSAGSYTVSADAVISGS